MNIYLAKSNRANPTLVSTIRSTQTELDNVEYVEFRGGIYSDTDLRNSKGLIVVLESGTNVIGKGLHNQILLAKQLGIPTLIVYQPDSNYPKFVMYNLNHYLLRFGILNNGLDWTYFANIEKGFENSTARSLKEHNYIIANTIQNLFDNGDLHIKKSNQTKAKEGWMNVEKKGLDLKRRLLL